MRYSTGPDDHDTIVVVDSVTGELLYPEPLMLTPDLLVNAIGCSRAASVRFVGPLDETWRLFSISTAGRLAMFFAHTGHESASLARQTESLDYSVERLLEVFGRHRISQAECEALGRTPTRQADQVAIANIVYGGSYGVRQLGNTQPGDGWRYRARGPIGLTGRGNYITLRKRLRLLIGPEVLDFEANPEALEEPRWGALSAGDFWDRHGLNRLADAGDFEATTRAINGGMNGHADRLVRLQRARAALAGWRPDGATISPAPAPTQLPAPAAPPTASFPAGEAGPPENIMPLPAIVASAAMSMAPDLLRGLGNTLINIFSPVAKQKVTAELARHGVGSSEADQIFTAAVTAARTVTGIDDPVQATAEVIKTPAVVQQVEDDTLDTLERLAPLLDKLNGWESQALKESDESREAAARRAMLVQGDRLFVDAKWFKLSFIEFLSLLFVCISAGGALALALAKVLDEQMLGAIVTLMLIAGYTGVREFWLGGSRGSTAKDVTISELARRPKGQS